MHVRTAHVFFLLYLIFFQIFDLFFYYSRPIKTESNNPSPRNSIQPGGPQSIRVLNYEAELLEEQVG